MPKNKKKGIGDNPTTGKEWIALAAHRGASIQEGNTFTSVETPKGKVHIYPGREKLDSQTQHNLRRWFKLLGLMAIAGMFYLRFHGIA